MLVDNSGGAAAVNLGNDGGVGGGGSDSAGGDDGDRNSAGNRWPREETLVLLQVRQSMDEAFRDSNLKAPLWDEVSRKLGEYGYTRSAKKCKEKFENIYKYHRRTKEEQTYSMEQTMSMPKATSGSVMLAKPVSQVPHGDNPNPSFELMDTSTSTTSSSGRGHVKKKRKLMEYFNGLMKQVLERQENLQKKFIEAIEKLEKDRMDREEEWRAQQLATKKREQGILAHERSASAAKDAAIISFLQKISEQSPPLQLPIISTPLEKILSMPQPQHNIRESSPVTKSIVHYSTGFPSSRWPKAEVEALITVRENMDMRYSDSGSKGSVWEEVSSAMTRLGYDRSSKRCKEKWENINKYYRRVKESNKIRRQDSKTCPYFDRLDSLYEKRSKKFDHSTSDSSGCNLKPEDILMQMIGHQREQVILESARKEIKESENVDRTPEDEDADDDDEEMDVEYHVAGNKNPSEAIAEQ
ncbi:putative Duplicated homeodomain-like superfamily protein [Heracleum sosnowskyi]|uniref:Duplicated homeodomain-like superfamily protein n=1 Tax=Heracleum sosnowskyi TaxID=360622 RepID=A0AAD8M4A3_9APIA|nr:putative Duplicated homeodomain-like superfamily protein [Heracleum sosnowskyi]